MGRGQILSLVLLLSLLSFILPCQGKPRGGRGGGGRGGGRGGRGGGGWRWFGGSSRGSSYSSGSSYHTTRSYSVVTTPKPTPETILSPTGAGKDKHLDLDFDSLLPILHQSERWTRGDRGLDSILRHTRYVEENTRYGTTFSSSSTLRRQLTEKKVTLAWLKILRLTEKKKVSLVWLKILRLTEKKRLLLFDSKYWDNKKVKVDIALDNQKNWPWCAPKFFGRLRLCYPKGLHQRLSQVLNHKKIAKLWLQKYFYFAATHLGFDNLSNYYVQI